MSLSTAGNRINVAEAIGFTTQASVNQSGATDGIGEKLRQISTNLYIISDELGIRIVSDVDFSTEQGGDFTVPVLGTIPAMSPDRLGDPTFCEDLGLRYPYVGGAMANGIASVEYVEALSRAGMLGFFGAAGLPVSLVEESVDRLIASLGDAPFGVNLIHSPNESDVEMAVANLLLDRGVHLIEASAFLKITAPVVKYRLKGLHRGADGTIVTPNHIVAKVSREELAEKFFSPAPEKIVGKLLEAGEITAEEAELSNYIPMAQDITAEADSGGHTDHRPALSLLPTLISLRDRMEIKHGYDVALRVGLGGGVSTPASALAAFAMGAAYIVTGSVNQACQESGTSDIVRQMLAETKQADVAKAPAADMFEMGVTVQVLKRGTMFAMRGNKLYELYRAHASMDEIPEAERLKLEKQVFRATLDETWASTREFWVDRDPRQVERAEREPKHKMALVFRSYLGLASVWANRGVEDRKMDYQVWCGPAMGAFNEWVRGSYMDDYKLRKVATVAQNILYGTAVLSRVQQARNLGVRIAPPETKLNPLTAEEIAPYFA
jgi:trans-AT polyketide synthase, acyltransferase and oxidoreductase domains